VHRNWLFMGISAIMVGVQILIVFEGGRAFPAVPLTGVQWGISVGLALLTLPLGALIRCIPNGPLEKAANRLRGKKRAETPPISAAFGKVWSGMGSMWKEKMQQKQETGQQPRR
jgi:ABC-type microcin C transport system permease subunit YejB